MSSVICPRCGEQLPEPGPYCVKCGAPLPGGDVSAPPAYPPAPGERTPEPWEAQQPAGFGPLRELTPKEFLGLPENKRLKNNLLTSAILCYVIAGINLAILLFASRVLNLSILTLIDVVLLLGLGLGIQLRQSRVCAVVLLAYSILGVIITYINTGKFGGYIILLAGIYGVASTFLFHKAWKEYRSAS